MMFKFILEGDITVGESEKIRRTIEEKYRDLAEVYFVAEASIAAPAVAGLALVGVAGSAASVISAIIKILVLMKDHKKEQTWTSRKLKGLVEDEMTRLGLLDYTIRKVTGFEALLKKENSPCVVEVIKNDTSDAYKIYVFQDKKLFTLRIKQHKTSRNTLQ